tara:strand:+ start:480 stop:1094 length:615 start_codon:yes stop_codon:yes gene_type:complete
LFRYEVEVVAAAGSGMGLYLMFACLCCTVFGGRSMRARHQTRWWSNKLKRVDGAIPYAAKESQREGEFFDHISNGQLLFSRVAGGAASAGASAGTSGFTFGSLLSGKGQLPARAHKLVVEDTAAPAPHTVFGAGLARALFALPANPLNYETTGNGAQLFSGVAGGAAGAGAGAGRSGFTFGSLLSGSGDCKDADAPPTPHKLRF